MKRLLSISCSGWAFNTGMLLLRMGAGIIMLPHGYSKLVHFAEKKNSFMNFLGIGSTLSLLLVIFAEFFCSMFLILGLFTRLSVIPLIISLSVVVFKVNNGNFAGDAAEPALLLCCFLVILMCGPGKASVDGLINK